MSDLIPLSDDPYAAWRTSLEPVRLTLQTFLLNQHFGWLLHPLADLSSIPNLQVADIATGTALWPIQLSQQLPPAATIIASDIDLSQCPARASLPSNLILEQWNVLEAPPVGWADRFDYIHMRLLVPGLRSPGDVDKALANFHKILKPGGIIQWEEWDYSKGWEHFIFDNTPDHTRAKLARFDELLTKAFGFKRASSAWSRSPAAAIEASDGFEQPEVVNKPPDIIFSKAFHASSVLFMAQMLEYWSGMDAENADEVKSLWRELVTMAEKGDFYTLLLRPTCCVARKKGLKDMRCNGTQ